MTLKKWRILIVSPFLPLPQHTDIHPPWTVDPSATMRAKLPTYTLPPKPNVDTPKQDEPETDDNPELILQWRNPRGIWGDDR